MFKNKDASAAAVVVKKINGKTRPIYISPVLRPSAGRLGGSNLIQTPMVAVWFQMDVDNDTMIESDMSEMHFVDKTRCFNSVTFDEKGF